MTLRVGLAYNFLAWVGGQMSRFHWCLLLFLCVLLQVVEIQSGRKPILSAFPLPGQTDKEEACLPLEDAGPDDHCRRSIARAEGALPFLATALLSFFSPVHSAAWSHASSSDWSSSNIFLCLNAATVGSDLSSMSPCKPLILPFMACGLGASGSL